MKKIATTMLNSGRLRLTLSLMVTVLILTTSVPSFAQQQIYMRTDVVAPYGTNVYHWTLVGREVELLGVSGDGDSDLDLYVYDENWNLVAKDDDYTDECRVRFTPRWTGSFTIKVVNRGKYANRYRIATN